MSSIPSTSTDDSGNSGPFGGRRFSADGDGSPAPAVTRAAGILDALEAAGGEPLGSERSGPHAGNRQILDVAPLPGIGGRPAHPARGTTGTYSAGAPMELGGAYLAGFDEVRSFYELCARTMHCASTSSRSRCWMAPTCSIWPGTRASRASGWQPISVTGFPRRDRDRPDPVGRPAIGRGRPPVSWRRDPAPDGRFASGLAALQARLAKAKVDDYASTTRACILVWSGSPYA